MQKLPEPSSPRYSVGSVDKALRLLHLLRDHGEVRIRWAAEELGVAESTVHRLMAMLVFYGFARQVDSKAYVPGYAHGVAPTRVAGTKDLRDTSIPHMEALSTETGETVSLAIRAGTKIRFLWSCEGDRALRIVNRTGVVIPAANSAGGRILLAHLSENSLRRLYQGPFPRAQGESLDDRELEVLSRELARHRQEGFAIANQEVEVGVTAIAVPLRNAEGRAVAALCLAVPYVRHRVVLEGDISHPLTIARDAIERELHGRGPSDPDVFRPVDRLQ